MRCASMPVTTGPTAASGGSFVGPGNNGGMGYVLARLARRIGLEPLVIAARAPRPAEGRCQAGCRRVARIGGA